MPEDDLYREIVEAIGREELARGFCASFVAAPDGSAERAKLITLLLKLRRRAFGEREGNDADER